MAPDRLKALSNFHDVPTPEEVVWMAWHIILLEAQLRFEKSNNEYAWKNIHILERERQILDDKLRASVKAMDS